jgi:hypothetical protein
LTVKAESKHGKRLNPRKADQHRWREAFAGQLRERGIDAEAARHEREQAPQRVQSIAGRDRKGPEIER